MKLRGTRFLRGSYWGMFTVSQERRTRESISQCTWQTQFRKVFFRLVWSFVGERRGPWSSSTITSSDWVRPYPNESSIFGSRDPRTQHNCSRWFPVRRECFRYPVSSSTSWTFSSLTPSPPRGSPLSSTPVEVFVVNPSTSIPFVVCQGSGSSPMNHFYLVFYITKVSKSRFPLFANGYDREWTLSPLDHKLRIHVNDTL